MKCPQAMSAILEADLSELEGEGTTPLAGHLRECSACRARARAILRAEGALARDLVEGLPLPDYDGILRQAGESEVLHGEGPWSRRSARLRSPSLRTLVPLAAAAALAFLFLAREPSLPGPEYHPPQFDPGLQVEAPQGQSVAVLATNNPDISVVWLF